MMTRKDYVNTADILWAVRYAISPEIQEFLIKEFSSMFKNDNPNFDPMRFENACKKG